MQLLSSLDMVRYQIFFETPVIISLRAPCMYSAPACIQTATSVPTSQTAMAMFVQGHESGFCSLPCALKMAAEYAISIRIAVPFKAVAPCLYELCL